ncbi:choice-of-anchor D domain-containing protein [Lentisalinibacter sediminis]|uniref:choice-of-anchor D domain-containing protein n=1 Tax=Lentisalinibacter sediminis TaxID=2992237 RepID=UPI00386BF3D3
MRIHRLLLFLAAASLPLIATAAQLTWSPLYVDFGQVTIGGTAYQTLTLTNEDAGEVITVSAIEFTFNQGGAFTWNAAVPAEILPGESLDIELSFTPNDWSFAMADMWIYNSSDNAPSLYIQLMGEGIEGDPCAPLTNCYGLCVDLQTDVSNCGTCGNACGPVDNGTVACESGECIVTCDEGYELDGDTCEPVVSESALAMLMTLIDDVDDYVADGTLFGYGPGRSADAHLKNFTRALSDASVNLLVGEEPQVQMACDLLSVWPRRCDGAWPVPPDQLAGEMAYVVSGRIIEVMEAIGAEYPLVICEPLPAIVPGPENPSR